MVSYIKDEIQMTTTRVFDIIKIQLSIITSFLRVTNLTNNLSLVREELDD